MSNTFFQGGRKIFYLVTVLIKTNTISFLGMLRRAHCLWPFAKKLYRGWISTMTSSNESSWKLPPPRNEELVAPLPSTVPSQICIASDYPTPFMTWCVPVQSVFVGWAALYEPLEGRCSYVRRAQPIVVPCHLHKPKFSKHCIAILTFAETFK